MLFLNQSNRADVFVVIYVVFFILFFINTTFEMTEVKTLNKT